MPSVIVVGGGLAGISAAAALGGAGFSVRLFEARPYLGGRATSYRLSPDAEPIDNCQHVLLACFTNLLNLYDRLGVADRIAFHREFNFIEPGGRRSVLRAGPLPAPAHLMGSLFRVAFLDTADKLAISRAVASINSDWRRGDLDSITMLDWLNEKRQPPRAVERFWKQVLVSAINEDLEHMAARHGLQVIRTGFLSSRKAYRMGLATVPLAELYGNISLHGVNVRCGLRADRVTEAGIVTSEGEHRADYYVLAVPFERAQALAPDLQLRTDAFVHSPITGIHLWFAEPVMDLPHATLLDRTIHWAFNKRGGRYVQLVVSASRALIGMPRSEVIALAVRELAEFFPKAGRVALERAHVVKELHATFSARPGLEALRPPAKSELPNVFLAGDWTRTGWPATMEGAVRSGYLAAEAVTAAAGTPRRFVV
ncbi:MAG: hydroxysqualene dehydroxylase HpnE [bacterium]|jgi:squalene-associated FAD-dependent desaturase